MTKEHIFLCISLKIPFVIVVTKIDMVKDRDNVLVESMDSINKIIKSPGIRRIPLKINTMDDVILSAKNIHTESITPIFHISNVTGIGIDFLKNFFNLIVKRHISINNNEVEYHIDSIFSVPGVGTVTGGQLLSGSVKVGDKLLIGPNNGRYEQTVVKSIHCKRVSVQSVESGYYVCFALKRITKSSIRRGNVLISLKSPQIMCKRFVAKVSVMRSHSTTIKEGFEPVVHASVIRQSAKIIEINEKVCYRNPEEKINDKVLRTGDKAIAIFEFVYYPEFLKPGIRILCAEGPTKLVGEVISCY